MNSKWMFQGMIATVVLAAPAVLAAQADPNAGGTNAPYAATQQGFPQTPQPGSQPMNPSGPQSSGSQSGSMRDSLGAPGVMGQQMLDQQFVRAAAQGSLGDVKLGTLAVQKGGPDVKEAAQKLVDDHTAMDKDMDSVADAMGILVPKKLNKEDQAEYAKLNGLSGKDFDTEYLNYSAKSHWQTLHSFYMEATASADTDLQAEVVKDMGILRQHLGLISKAATAEGITLPPRPPRPAAPPTTAKK